MIAIGVTLMAIGMFLGAEFLERKFAAPSARPTAPPQDASPAQG
jgi:hypothetical protein